MKPTLRLFGLLALWLTGCTNGLVDEVPRLYACDRAEGLDACPGRWRCGLAGYCQNPDQALPYACETAADCSTTWHCGTERVCYDRAAAQDRSCRTSSESIPDGGDCAPGWRCGREVRGQVCHPLDAGAAYLCVSDSDCEATWRCGPEGACVDVAAQGLRPGEVNFTMAKVSPLLPTGVELLQVSGVRLTPNTGFIPNRMVFAADGGLHVVTNSASRSWPFSFTRDSIALVRPAHGLVELERHLLVSDSSGLTDYRGMLDGGAPVPLPFPSLSNAEFRYAFASSQAEEELAAFSGTTIGLCGRDGGSTLSACDPSTLQLATLPAPITDVVFVDDRFGRRSALAATTAGPWFAPRSGSSFLGLDGGPTNAPIWRRMALPGLSDACAPTPTPIDRLSYDAEKRLLTAVTDQNRKVSVFTRLLTPQNTNACASLEFKPAYGPCAACGPGEVLVKTGTPSVTIADPTVLALCQRSAADGGTLVVGYRHLSFDGGCSLAQVSLPPSVSRGYQVSAQTDGLQGLDAVGTPRWCPLPGCETMLCATAPDRIAGGPGLLGTYNDDFIDDSAQFQTPPSGLSSPLGMRVANFTNLYIAGSVTENPDWMISSTGRQGTQGDQSLAVQPMFRKLNSAVSEAILPLAVFTRSADLLPSAGMRGTLIDASNTKSFSTIATDAQGTPWLIVGAGDRIWATDSRLLGEDAGVRTIGIKAVPLASADIQSLAFAAFDRGDAGTGPLLDGYTVEQQRLFRVVVHSPTLWLTDELRLGETTAVAIAVWMDGKRGRVGTSDGRVFGLPVPVLISRPIPELMPTVLNYSSLCGQAFALSSSALYRLSLETPPLGTWKRVSLESAYPGLDAFGSHWAAAVHRARVGNTEHLYLFSQTGLTIELVATCP